MTSANAAEEVFHARLVAALGPRRAEALLQGAAPLRLTVPDGLDLRAITYVVGDALRGVGAPPVFSGLAAPVARVGPASDLVPNRRSCRETTSPRDVAGLETGPAADRSRPQPTPAVTQTALAATPGRSAARGLRPGLR